MKQTREPSKATVMTRVFAVETVARVLSLARTTAKVLEDRDLLAALERIDALLFHEATSFLKLPFMPRGRRRRKK
jgi:hypothetical protein